MMTLPGRAYLPLTINQAISVITFMTRAYPNTFEWERIDTGNRAMYDAKGNANTFQFHLPNGASVYASDCGRYWFVYCHNGDPEYNYTVSWLTEDVGLTLERTALAVREEAL